MQTPPACQCLTKILSLWKLTRTRQENTNNVTTKATNPYTMFVDPLLSSSIVVVCVVTKKGYW